ncbi:long-chain-fatty-acid--CoA ligase [Bordetella holmesii]|uniref:Long-chain-fatty-acid--CoA ligase n=2 Tax=Bordetella holmesii TaxID=35814 RepID=A0A158M0U4_9BORD|nr:long-chain-fatty-acid--CoA ligase [Bordetella holmesii]AHV91925.1 long-chain-fatty-acid--CoA ligase [Bordetella holmesii ATCC 51541]AIT27440.1 long-chain-fatty-acid--CoA ligase [Bordetella holmesii 44057]EWM42028.1 long-chain-fatty-acid--CoA ligase [Bordetella holmesii 41130]EWM48031.1 long-chain-fatty-acid--CoA ligase [Bordetella holmesii 35009]EWM49012.1 long-chain-fatty-acid--CoA ligase [Bordetella holmesii 70147]
MERIWLRNYPQGVPADIQATGTLLDVLEEAFERFADKTAYMSMGAELRYGDVERLSRNLANWLRAQGLAPGDRVAVMMPNMLQYPLAAFGILRAGCVVVNCNPLYTARELRHQLADSGARAIIIAENFAATLQAVLPDTKIKHIVVTSVGDMLRPFKARLVNFMLRRVRKLVPAWTLPGHTTWHSALHLGSQHVYERPDVAGADLAFLQYTGGTTGTAKAAMLSHLNMVANLNQAHAWIRPLATEGKECVVTALPLYHIFALTANCLTFLKLGARNLLILNPRDIRAMVRELRRHPFTCFTGVNTLFYALLDSKDFRALDFSPLRLTLGGCMAVQKTVAERWREVTGKPLAQAYGLTEASPAVALNPLDQKDFNGSVGLPVPATDISIRDEHGQEIAPGQSGEICVRGPQVMSGYWQQAAETARAFYPQGFLRTGDMGYVDPEGYLFLVDRKKDLILVSGFNVYPSEVEEVAATCPGIREAAAVGWPDERSGEAVKLFVIATDPALTEKSVIDYCRRYLTGYKVPRHVVFRNELPRSNVGKILRRKLREESLAQ